MKKVLLGLMFLGIFSFSMFGTSCNNGGGEACCNSPKDANCDKKCDNCGATWYFEQKAAPCDEQLPGSKKADTVIVK